MPEFRIDRASFSTDGLRKPRKLPGGRLRLDAYLARTGVLIYRNSDGTERRELRLPAEVFNADSLETFRGAVLTEGHPSVGLLDATTSASFARGAVGDDVRADGDKVHASITVFDSALIEAMRSGQAQEISVGYECELDFTPGVTASGERFDAVQRAIKVNHVAVVAKGRAGDAVRARMDAAVEQQQEIEETGRAPEKVGVMGKKITIAEVEYEVAEAVAAHIEELEAAGKVLSTKLDTAERAYKTDEARYEQRVKTRVALEKVAEGLKVKHDGLTDVQIKKAVVKYVLHLDVSDAEVAGAFKAALIHADSDRAGIHTTVTPAEGGPGYDRYDSNGNLIDPSRTAEQAREDHAKRTREAWKAPIPGALHKHELLGKPYERPVNADTFDQLVHRDQHEPREDGDAAAAANRRRSVNAWKQPIPGATTKAAVLAKSAGDPCALPAAAAAVAFDIAPAPFAEATAPVAKPAKRSLPRGSAAPTFVGLAPPRVGRAAKR